MKILKKVLRAVMPTLTPGHWRVGASYDYKVRVLDQGGVVQIPRSKTVWEVLTITAAIPAVFFVMLAILAPHAVSAVKLALWTAGWSVCYVGYRRSLVPMGTLAAAKATSHVLKARAEGRLSRSGARKVLGWVRSADVELHLVETALTQLDAQIDRIQAQSTQDVDMVLGELVEARRLVRSQESDARKAFDSIDTVIASYALPVDESGVAEALASARAARSNFGSAALQARSCV